MRLPLFRAVPVLTVGLLIVLPTVSAHGRAMKFGDPVRKQLMNAVRPRVEKALKTKVIFKATTANLVDNWAFMIAEPLHPNGKPLDYAKTPFAKAWKDGAFGGLVIALFKKEKGRWTVSRYSFGASDVPWVDWGKETGAPKSVFPR
jgi:hypothetical protein